MTELAHAFAVIGLLLFAVLGVGFLLTGRNDR